MITFAACLVASITALPLIGQSTYTSAPSQAPSPAVEEQIRLLREEVLELRTEVKSLRQELHRQEASLIPAGAAQPSSTPSAPNQTYRTQSNPNLQSGNSSAATTTATATAAAPASAGQESDASAEVGVLQSQVAQLAQTKVESASKWPVKIYGTILSSTFFNTHDVDWGDTPILVDPQSQVFHTGSFSSSLRQSRIGIAVDGPTIGSFQSTAVFAMDFMGGMTDFQATPTFGLADIVYAYGRLENAHTAIEAGQDEMILAPGNPTSMVAFAYPELYEAGNLYLRAPQVRLEQRLASSEKGGQLRLTLGLVAPIGTYQTFDYPGGAVSNGWKRPALQGRLAWRSEAPDSVAQSGWTLGVSGHYGILGLPLVDASGNPVSSFSTVSWAGAVDFSTHYHRIRFSGEGFLGQNLQSLGGGIGQPGKDMGGYFEGGFQATRRLQFNSGLGDDHLLRPIRIPVDLNRNTAFFGNTIFQFTPEIGASLEYRYMITRPFDGTTRRNDNVNLGLAYSF